MSDDAPPAPAPDKRPIEHVADVKPTTLPDHPNAFSDPIPGKKPKQPKPADPGQASLF